MAISGEKLNVNPTLTKKQQRKRKGKRRREAEDEKQRREQDTIDRTGQGRMLCRA